MEGWCNAGEVGDVAVGKGPMEGRQGGGEEGGMGKCNKFCWGCGANGSLRRMIDSWRGIGGWKKEVP